MHIHPGSPNSSQSEDSAATKIQAGFRGYRVRKQLKQQNNSGIHNRRGRAVYQMDPNKNSNSSNHDSSSRLNGIHTAAATTTTTNNDNNNCEGSIEEKCATKIQAGIRGYLVRKHQKREQEAATKIQAGFRGFKVRKELQKFKPNK